MRNAAAQMLIVANKCESMTPVLWKLDCLPIAFHSQYQVLFWTVKALNHLCPGRLKDSFLRYWPLRALCSTREALLVVPSVWQVGTRVTAFAAGAQLLWNSPPPPLGAHQSPSLMSFCQQVKMLAFCDCVWFFHLK